MPQTGLVRLADPFARHSNTTGPFPKEKKII